MININYHIPTDAELRANRRAEEKRKQKNQQKELFDLLFKRIFENYRIIGEIFNPSIDDMESEVKGILENYSKNNILLLDYQTLKWYLIDNYDKASRKAQKYYKSILEEAEKRKQIDMTYQDIEQMHHRLDLRPSKQENGFLCFLLGVILKK